MKVLQKGIANKFTIACPNCKSLLEGDNDDIKTDIYYYPTVVKYSYCKCPVCQKSIKINIENF